VRVSELRSSTTLAITRWEEHCRGVLCLDNAFALIEGHPGGLGGSRVGHPPKILNNAAFTVNVTTPIHTHSKATSPARILPAVPVDMNFDRVRIEHFLLPSKSVSGDRNV